MLAGPGSDLSEESAVGVEPAALDLRSRPQVSSWVRFLVRLRVAQELSVDDVGELPFQTPHGFFVTLAGGSFAAIVGAAVSVVSDLGDRHDVDGAHG